MIVRIPREPIERFIKKGGTMTLPENDKRMVYNYDARTDVTVRQPVQVYKAANGTTYDQAHTAIMTDLRSKALEVADRAKPAGAVISRPHVQQLRDLCNEWLAAIDQRNGR